MNNRYILKALFIGTVFFSILEVSCDRDNKPTLGDFQYPIAIGNSWTYARSYSPYNWVPGAGSEVGVDTIFDTSFTEIVSLVNLSDTVSAYYFETAWYSNGDTSHMTEYINNNDSGLFEYAYLHAGWTGPANM